MTVPSTTRRAGPFTGTGALVAYPFEFKVFAKQDLAVTIADSNGLETDLVLDSTFTVTLNVDQEATPGGTVNYAAGGVATALPSGYTLVVTGDGLEFEQTADLPQGGNFSPVVIENALDRIVMLLQRLWDGVRRSMRLPDTASDNVSTVLPVPTANNFIGWDSNGTALRNVDPNTLATVVAFAAWQSQAFSGDGVTTQFTLSSDPGNVNNLDVVVGAVPQRNNVDFTLSGTTLTFDVAPANGLSIFCRWGQALPEGTSTLQTRLASTASAADGDALVGVKSTLTGGTARTQHAKNADIVSIKDFGAIGTAVPSNVTADAAAFAACFTDADTVYVPEGAYYVNDNTAGITIGPGKSLIGAGSGKTIIYYTGTGNGIYMGAPGSTSLAYDCTLQGVTLNCTNRASTVNGIYLDNAVYFTVDDVTTTGSGQTNSSNPADRVLYGSGLLATNNSIIGRIHKVSCRQWNFGYYFYTLAGSQSYWTAAIEVSGQAELGTNMYGMVFGDSSIGYYTGVGVSVRDITVQGNYTMGILVNTGDNIVFDNVYCEGNANYDYVIGTSLGAPAPIGIKILNSPLNTEDIGTTPYGTFPYITKIKIDAGVGTVIQNNNLSISSSIPLITVGASAEETRIIQNRLNSGAAVSARISNASTSTITRDNYPEAPVATTGSFTRALNGATATVAYTGVGFKPTSIEFWAAVDSTNERSFGCSDAGSGIRNRCMTTDSTGANTSSSDCIRIIRSSAGNEQKASLASFDLDGFTLNWTLVGTPPGNTLTVNYIARR